MDHRSAQFARLWANFGPPGLDPTPELRFHQARRWRFDFAWPEHRLAVEIEGITFYGGRKSRHQTARGLRSDCEKYNAATENGWRILRYTQLDLDERPIDVVQQIAATLKRITMETLEHEARN